MSKALALWEVDPEFERPGGHNALHELMRAVVLNAIADFQRGKRHAEQARKFFLSDESEYVFSFRNICSHLQISVEGARKAILKGEGKIGTRRRLVYVE